MAAIKALLNPMADNKNGNAMPLTPESSPTMTELYSPRKKAKLTKDAPVFNPGPVRGECRFPPDEYQDAKLAAYHQQFEVSPFGEIADYPRHIPYNSEKKSFLEKTHREYLEVFQYTFKVPGDDHVYTMLWDYNIGLVRTTPLFKCTGHSKTTPAKMLNRNPGLRDICHSITGGALVAQGYWIPYAAARALASTFCWDVRYALTPVFGHDFPSLCIKPGEDGFGDMTIDPAITKFCTEQAKRFREQEASAAPMPASLASPLAPSTPTPRRHKAAQAKRIQHIQPTYTSPYSSPYTSEFGSDDGYTTAASTPAPPYRHLFTPINTPRQPPRSVPYPERQLPTPRDILTQYNPRYHAPRTPPTRCSSPQISPKSIPVRATIESLHFCQQSPLNSYPSNARHLNWLGQHILPEDEEAAYVLLALKLAKTPEDSARGLGITMPRFHEDGRRSASA